jgi:hypothetical protein
MTVARPWPVDVRGMTVKTVIIEKVSPYVMTVEVEGDGKAPESPEPGDDASIGDDVFCQFEPIDVRLGWGKPPIWSDGKKRIPGQGAPRTRMPASTGGAGRPETPIPKEHR